MEQKTSWLGGIFFVAVLLAAGSLAVYQQTDYFKLQQQGIWFLSEAVNMSCG